MDGGLLLIFAYKHGIISLKQHRGHKRHLQYNNTVDVRGHKYVFGPSQNHFSPSVARVKMSSEEGQKHIYAQERQLYYYYNNFKGLLTFNV